MASKRCDRAFSAYSCARAALVEHYGDGLAGEGVEEGFWYRAGFEGMFVGVGVTDESCQLGGGKICDG